MQNKKSIFLTISLIIVLFIIATYFYKNSQSNKAKELSNQSDLTFQRQYSFVKGDKNAKVQLVEFFDPACGTCAIFHYYVKDIMEENKGKIKLVLRYAPFHKNSDYTVKILEGAREQGLFLETLEFMFQTQKYWLENHIVNPMKLWTLLSNIKGLDLEKLAIFMNKNSVDNIITQDLKDAETLNVDKTPSYFINKKPLKEFSLENLKKLIESQL